MNNLKYNKLNKASSYRFLPLLSICISAIGPFFISQSATSSPVFRFKINSTPHPPSSASPLTETYLGATTNDPCGSSTNNRLGSNRKKYPPNKKCLKITKGS